MLAISVLWFSVLCVYLTIIFSLFQAVSSFKKRGVNIEWIEEAIGFVNNQLSVDDSSMLAGKASTPADANHVTPASQDQSTACSSVSSAANNAPDPNLDRLPNQNEVKIPSEPIVHCVATLLMIQVISSIYSIIFCLQS